MTGSPVRPALAVALCALAIGAAPAGAQAPDPEPSPVDPAIADGSAAKALAAAEKRWAATKLRSYRMRVRLQCFCGPQTTSPRTITVRRGRTVGKVHEAVRAYATVPRLFAYLRKAIRRRAAVLDVSYAKATGRPTSIYVDQSLMIADEELGIRIDRFRKTR